MEEKEQNKNQGTGCIIAFFIVFAIIVIPMMISMISSSVKDVRETNHKSQLISEGKEKNSNEVINEIIEILKNEDESKLKEYLTDNFLYYDNNNISSKYTSSFFRDLKILYSTYEIERRGDTSSNDWATYRIYWNVVEENKKNGVNRAEIGYCLQTITIMLKKVVKQDSITYEIEKIILKNN